MKPVSSINQIEKKKYKKITKKLVSSSRNRKKTSFLVISPIIFPVTMTILTNFLEFTVGTEKVTGVAVGVLVVRVATNARKFVRPLSSEKLPEKLPKNWFLHQETRNQFLGNFSGDYANSDDFSEVYCRCRKSRRSSC